MADLLIEQLCQTLAEKLQAAPTAGLNDLITYLRDAIESNVTLKTALTEKAVQINQGDARGYQVLVEGGRAYIGEHLHVSDPSLVETALNTILNAYALKPVGIPSNLPLSGVVKFVGRDGALVAVHEKFQQTTTVAITSVSGMGGVGKTELALQYAYSKLRENTYPGGICWIQARSQDVGIGILEFARNQLGLPQPPEHLKTVPQQVKWVCGRWRGEPILIVLDDVTDYAEVEPYLQQLDPRFQVLMTTRLKLGTAAQRLELEVLTEDASLELLQVLVHNAERINSQLEDAKRLCEWLGRLPLGLELVGRYLARKQDLSLTQMLERLQAKKLEARALVQTEKQAEKMTAKLGVAAAFQLTWEEKDFPYEARLLCGLLSVFALAPIPWKLVKQCLFSWDEEDLEDYRDDQLLGRSLLSRVGQERYQLHQLIREFFAVKLKTELSEVADVLKRRFTKVLASVAEAIPQTVTLDVITQVECALPHIEVVAEELTHFLENEDKNWPLVGLSQIAGAQSRWQEAEKWLKRSLQISETQLGKDHPDTAGSLGNLATLYVTMGRYREAEPLYARSLQIHETQLGKDHPHTATILSDFACLYKEMGCYGEAEFLFQRSLQIRKTQLGSDHPQTAFTLNGLAELYRSMGCYREAEPLYVRSLQIRETWLGRDHIDTGTSLNNLAELYRMTGCYREAEPLYVRSLQINETQLGKDHPQTASSLNNLALLYQATGRYREAEPLYVRSLEISEAQLSKDHPHTVFTINNLASLYEAMERYSEAEPLYVQSLQIRETQWGRDHPDTATSFNNLAAFYEAIGRYNESESLYLSALEIRMKSLPENHPYIQTTWNNFRYLIQRAVESDRTQELSSHPITQALLQEIQAQNE